MTDAAGGGPNAGLPLQVVLGRCDDMRAEVFVRVASPARAGSAISMAGTLVGPQSRRAITLPVTAVLADQGHGLARAILTEPSFWTPDLPNLYRLQVRVTAGEQVVAGCDRLVGLRRLGVRGRSFWLDGRRWVARGAWCTASSFAAGALHEQAAAAVIADPGDDLLSAADEAGVGVLAVLADATGRAFARGAMTDRVAAWALHPAVLAAILPEAATHAAARDRAADLRRLKGTMLLGWTVDGTRPPPEVPPGIDVLVLKLPSGAVPDPAWRHSAPPLPLVAWRHDGVAEGAGRPRCDGVQAELAAWGLATGVERLPWDWAGYLVS